LGGERELPCCKINSCIIVSSEFEVLQLSHLYRVC
jgi:hypothetical protein